MADEHDSFELEDVIIDMSTEVEGETRRAADADATRCDPTVSSTPMWSSASTSPGRWSEGLIYRKYKFAVQRIWNVDDLDFTQDAEDWKRI